MENARIPMKILKMRKGEELKVYVSKYLREETSLMNNSYRQALRAVAGIVERTDKFHLEASSPDFALDDELLSFGSNVIAFSAERGCGKTSTMLSFSWMLESMDKRILNDDNHVFLAKNDRDALENVRFHVLSPISPSVLEEKQNILYVVLARLYDYAQRLFREAAQGYGRKLLPSRSNSEHMDQLRRELQGCYDGILGVKQRTEDMPRDILELQDICDGLSLCRSFYSLVDQITTCLGGNNNFLVLQLDDADSQIQNGFEVLEDVRKYLQVPNLIVLMSADIELIQDLVLQDFQKYFPNRSGDIEFHKRLIRTCRKYIDKLIPPTHLIGLLQLDSAIEQYSDQLHLHYFEGEDENGGRSVLPWADGLALQDMLLQLIFRKTGIVFVKPYNRAHSIIPTTLRGLHQMMKMLTDMDDIPQIEDKTSFEDFGKLTQMIAKQIVIQEYNLSQFTDYFADDWIYVKITNQFDRNFLASLRDVSGEYYVSLTIDYLCERYNLEKPKVHNSVKLDSIMYSLQKTSNSLEDVYLLFSIRTLFTLKHHKMILSQKRDALNRFDSEKTSLFAVDYDPYKLYLSKSYLVNENVLEASFGTSRSISRANQEYEELRNKSNRHKSDSGSAENTSKQREQLHKQLDELELEYKEIQQKRIAASEQLRVAKAELEAVQSVNPTYNAYGERVMLNAKKSMARAEAIFANVSDRESTLEKLLSRTRSQVKETDIDYESLLNEQKNADEDYARGKAKYNEEMGFYQGEHNALEMVPEEVHPEFVIRNALHREWEFHRMHAQYHLSKEKQLAKELLLTCMVEKDADGRPSVNFLNLITFFLRLGRIAPEKVEGYSQQMVYYVQECALMFAANWEVQDLVYRRLRPDYSVCAKVPNCANCIPGAEGCVTIWLDGLLRSLDRILREQLNDGSEFKHLVQSGTASYTDEDGATVNCWSLLSGYHLITGKTYSSAQLNFEQELRVIYDLS